MGGDGKIKINAAPCPGALATVSVPPCPCVFFVIVHHQNQFAAKSSISGFS